MISDVFREELRRLRESGRTFAQQHPDAARFLAEPGSDPDVERLLEGVAWLTASTRERIAAVDDEVVQGLCSALLPTALRPMPALSIVRFSGQRLLREPERVVAGTALDSVAVDGEPCRFRLAWDADIPAASITAIELHAGERPRLEIHLALADGATPARFGPRLRLFASAEPVLARALVRALVTAHRVQAVDASGSMVPLTAAWIGPGVAPAILPGDPGLARGHAILAEALAWPALSLFVDLSGPTGFGMRPEARGVRIVAELTRLPPELRGLASTDLLPGCAPAVNLWPAPAEPLLIDGTRRETVLAVAGRPMAKPWAVTAVRGSGEGRHARMWPRVEAWGGSGPCWQELRLPGGEPALAIGGLDASARREVLSIDLLAHDGARAGRIAAGDLSVATMAVPGSLAFRNLVPVERGVEPPVGRARLALLAARLRLATSGIREAEDLRRLLDLHDRRADAEGAGRAGAARVSGLVRACRMQVAAVPFGAAAARAQTTSIEVDDAASGWLLGNALDHALANLAPLGTCTAVHLSCPATGEQHDWPARCVGALA